MRAVKLIGAVLAVVLLSGMTFVGCGPDEVAPPPAGPPPAGPPPAEPPPTEPPPTGPPPHEEVKLEFYSSPSGAPPYAISVASSAMMNELHPWLRASTLEGIGTVETIHAMDAIHPKRRPYVIANSVGSTMIPAAYLGMEPYARKFTDLKFILTNPADLLTFCTFAPNIKTPQDFVGKRVAHMGRASTPTPLSEGLLRDAWGVFDQIENSYHPAPRLKDILITGVADVAFAISLNPKAAEGEYGLAPYTAQILGAKETYWFNITPEDVRRVDEKNIFKTAHEVVPKGTAGEGAPPTDIGHAGFNSGWFCWETCPEEVIYELVKFFAENDEERTKRCRGLRMGAEYLAAWPGLTEDMIHPGALKYYKEHNIKIGI